MPVSRYSIQPVSGELTSLGWALLRKTGYPLLKLTAWDYNLVPAGVQAIVFKKSAAVQKNRGTLFKNTMSVCLALQPGKDGVAALGGVKEVDAGDGRNGHLAVVRVVEVKGEGALPELVAAVKAELVDHAQLRGA